MNKWNKETQAKIDECVINICNLIDEHLYKNCSFSITEDIKNYVDQFADWLQRYCIFFIFINIFHIRYICCICFY